MNSLQLQSGRFRFFTLLGCAAFIFKMGVHAETVAIPNPSFELPTTGYVNINLDYWQKMPKPEWYEEDEEGGFLWNQLVGVFKNTGPGNPDRITNCHGDQAIWLFAVPEVGLFQDYKSVDWNDGNVPTHAFNQKFEIGKSYKLTTGVIGGGGGMAEGVSMDIRLYYLNDLDEKVTVASTTVVNTLAKFPTNTQFVDFTVQVPVVKPGDAWARRQIGIQFISNATFENEGGYWDLDNVRLTSEIEPPFQLGVSKDGTDIQISWPSVAGYNYQLQTSDSLSFDPPHETPVSGNGSVMTRTLPLTGAKRFYRVVVTPMP